MPDSHQPVRDAGDPHAPQEAADPRRWKALAVIGLAQFMLILDLTVINVALPGLGADLDLSRSAFTWAVSAYVLFFGGLLLLGGRLADVFGARRLMLTGLAIFTLASLASGLAQNEILLIGGRVGQGVGAALLSPAALRAVTSIFHGEERNKALSVWAAIGGLGFAAGVLIGGVLTAGPGWRWQWFRYAWYRPENHRRSASPREQDGHPRQRHRHRLHRPRPARPVLEWAARTGDHPP
jgi:MFS family permease